MSAKTNRGNIAMVSFGSGFELDRIRSCVVPLDGACDSVCVLCQRPLSERGRDKVLPLSLAAVNDFTCLSYPSNFSSNTI